MKEQYKQALTLLSCLGAIAALTIVRPDGMSFWGHFAYGTGYALAMIPIFAHFTDVVAPLLKRKFGNADS